MSKLAVTANFHGDNGKYNIGLSLVEFQENDVTIIYSPALDLSGYGNTQVEAKNSFTEALHEFFRYCINKKSLHAALEQLGWEKHGSNKKPKFSPPKDSELAVSNPLFNDIVNNKAYKVSREDLEMTY